MTDIEPVRPESFKVAEEIRAIEDPKDRAEARMAVLKGSGNRRAVLVADAIADADWTHRGQTAAQWAAEAASLKDEVLDRLVWAARQRGLSVNGIRDELGMSHGAVQRAIERGREVYQPGTPAEPDTTTGKDGKSYPAKAPARPKVALPEIPANLEDWAYQDFVDAWKQVDAWEAQEKAAVTADYEAKTGRKFDPAVRPGR